MSACFDPDCRACPRLNDYLCELRQQYPDYHNLPVAPFGDPQARLLIVGLAPGLHGANASGRPFVGDASGELLYQTLHQFSFANLPVARADDAQFRLLECRITNAVKCLPPQNKPITAEIKECNHFLAAEIASLPAAGVLVALGALAHDAILRALALKRAEYRFAHNAQHSLPSGMTLIDSYHCSRYNTQTKRLTPEMFAMVFAGARQLLG